MNWVFLDPLSWDYDVDSPLVRPLGGSQSALCYLAKALARRGHHVSTLTNTSNPRQIDGVFCFNSDQFPSKLLHEPQTIIVELNGPADWAWQFRSKLPTSVPLILWTQIAHNQPTMAPLADPTCAKQWDRIVCVSNWHKSAFHTRLGVSLSQMDVLKNAIGPVFENLFDSADDLRRAKSAELRLAYTSAPFRGLDVLLLCFPELKRRYPECRLDIFPACRCTM